MRAFLDCVPCLVGQCHRAARLATDDPELQAEALRAVLRYLQQADLSSSPIDISLEPHRLVREVTGCPDPYASLKAQSNAEALQHYPRLKEVVRSSDDPLLTAVRIAAAGNITADVLRLAAIALPALAAGILLGALLDRRLSHERFRIVVLGLILATGVLLLI